MTDKLTVQERLSILVEANRLAVAVGPGANVRGIFEDMVALVTGVQKIEEKLEPAVPADESITDEHIICLEDGRKLKMLKRHLRTKYGLTPEQYRERWGLRADYPMTAPAYSRKRSAMASAIGLGKRTGRRRAA